MATIAELIGYNQLPPLKTTHRWNSQFGIELELEEVQDNHNGSYEIAGWTRHHDASLRNGIEFVTAPPVGGEALEAAIDAFYKKGMSYTNGPRTSTHIHVNMLDASEETIKSMVMIMYTLEDGLYASTEQDRKWGGYSVALTEMPANRLRSILNAPHPQAFINALCPTRNAERYYGFNTNVRKHGTVEFRYFPGGPTKQELISWVDFVNTVKLVSAKYTTGQLLDLIVDPSSAGYFITQHFGEWGARLLSVCTPEYYYSKFEEIAAMAGDEDNRETSSNILYINPAYLDFLEERSFNKNKEGMTYLRNLIKMGNVYTSRDWTYYLSNAANMGTQDVFFQNPFQQQLEEPEDYDDDYDEGPDEEPVVQRRPVVNWSDLAAAPPQRRPTPRWSVTIDEPMPADPTTESSQDRAVRQATEALQAYNERLARSNNR